MLRFHLNRLWESAEATGLGAAARAEGRQSLERRTTKTIARAMESFWEGKSSKNNKKRSKFWTNKTPRACAVPCASSSSPGPPCLALIPSKGAHVVFCIFFLGHATPENANAAEGCPECMVTVLYACGGSAEDTAAAAAARHSADDAQRQEKAGAEGRRGGLQISAHAWPLPAPPRGGRGRGAEVLVAGSGRELPWAKHSSWLRERRRLDELKARVRFVVENICSNRKLFYSSSVVCFVPINVPVDTCRLLVHHAPRTYTSRLRHVCIGISPEHSISKGWCQYTLGLCTHYLERIRQAGIGPLGNACGCGLRKYVTRPRRRRAFAFRRFFPRCFTPTRDVG